MTLIEPLRDHTFAPGSLPTGRAISEYPPKSGSAPASDHLLTAPALRHGRPAWVTLTFDLRLLGG